MDMEAEATVKIEERPDDIEADVVSYILDLEGGFSSLSYAQQIKIASRVRPTPKMRDLINTNERGNRAFSYNWYEKYTWLTASETKNKLFCWPCVLFANKRANTHNTWCQVGYDNLKELFRALHKHDLSKEHTYSQLKLDLFGKNNDRIVDNDLVKRESDNHIEHNEIVKNNHAILRRLIDIVIYLSCQEVTFIERDRGEEERNYKELIWLLMKYDREFSDLLSSDLQSFDWQSQTVRNELTASVRHVLSKAIEDDVKKAICFSFQIDKSVDMVTCQPQLSIIIRYALNGDVFERFLGFSDLTRIDKREQVFDIVQDKLKQFDPANKLVGQSYDGALVMAGDLTRLGGSIRKIAPQALFTPCHAHDMNLVLQDACAHIKECRIFFANLSGFQSFFSNSPKRLDILHQLIIQDGAQADFSSSRLVSTVAELRNQLLETFDIIVQGEQFSNDYVSVREAINLKFLLNDLNFNILLSIFKKIFNHTDVIFNMIQNQNSDVAYSNSRILKLIENLKAYREKNCYFQLMLIEVQELIEASAENLPNYKKQKIDVPTAAEFYETLYYDIIDIVIIQIEKRFSTFEKLKFFELLNHAHFADFALEFPKFLLEHLFKHYPTFFIKLKLENELKVLYSDPLIFGSTEKIIDLYQFIHNNSLQNTIPEIYRLLSLLLSLSATPIESPCLKRVKAYSRNVTRPERMSNLSQMSIEKDLLKELQNGTTFHEDVINHFATSTSCPLTLVYRN